MAGESQLAGRGEAEPTVEGGRSLKEDQWLGTLCDPFEPVANQARTDAASLKRRSDADRAEDKHVDQSPRCVEEAPTKEHVSDDLGVVLGNERQPIDPIG